MRTILATLLMLSSIGLHAQTKVRSSQDLIIDERHIVTFSPIGMTVSYEYFNPAFSLDYEYIFNREAGIGVQLPLVFGFEGPEQGDYIFGGYYNHTSVFAAPGIRFHAPFGRRRNREFITGPAVIIGNMHFRPNNNGYQPTAPAAFNYNLTGLAANTSYNVYNRHFVFGIDARVGALFQNYDNQSKFFIDLGMHFGGKF